MSFSKSDQIKKMKPFCDKLVKQYVSKGYEFFPTDGELENVVFITPDKRTIKISHHSFYRFSGICCKYKELDKHLFEVTDITDEMFVKIYLKVILDALFA
jgi:hypothetical protein